MELTQRQSRILNYIYEKQSVKRLDVEQHISSTDDKISKITIIRDLDILLKQNLIEKTGYARNIVYTLAQKNELLRIYNTDETQIGIK